MIFNRSIGGTAGPRGMAMQIAVVLLAAAALAGCGKKSAPQPPPGVPLTYPQPYPSE